MAQKIISARVNINDYANRVLGIIKHKFGLKDKSEALNKFIELYGDEFIEKQASDKYVKKVSKIAERHFDKYGKKKMSIEELDKLCEVE
jgi:hypothetical protein